MAAKTTEFSIPPVPSATNLSHLKVSNGLIAHPAIGTSELSANHRLKVSKALKVDAFRIYLRFQFSLALLYAEWALLELCEFGLQLVARTKSFFKYSRR
jgi:hypothetical protein